jgi:hypothetical protein
MQPTAPYAIIETSKSSIICTVVRAGQAVPAPLSMSASSPMRSLTRQNTSVCPRKGLPRQRWGTIRFGRSHSRGHGRKDYRLVHEFCFITPMILKTGRDLMRCGDRPNDLKRLGRKDLYLLNLR